MLQERQAIVTMIKTKKRSACRIPSQHPRHPSWLSIKLWWVQKTTNQSIDEQASQPSQSMNQITTQRTHQTNQLWSSCPPGGTKLAPGPTRRRPASTTTLSCTHFLANTKKTFMTRIFREMILREALCQIKIESRKVSSLLQQL